MRKDMFEIIIERPRYGHSCGWPGGKGRHAAKLRQDPDCLPLKQPMWFPGRSKELNENLAPLRRFLDRRVGRPWNSVWSEIREHLSPSNTVQKHVFDHVVEFVERNPVMIDGIPHHAHASGGKHYPLRSHGRWGSFYVCPRTGLLCRAADAHKRKARNSDKKNGSR